MATRVEAEVVVTQTAESPPPEQREGGEDPPTEKEKKGLFRRFSKKEKGEKSKKPPGVFTLKVESLPQYQTLPLTRMLREMGRVSVFATSLIQVLKQTYIGL